VLAANDVLDEVGAAPEPVLGVPQRGLLAGWTPPGPRRARVPGEAATVAS
jgi:carotenoid phi-ring synthase / carotenoid chi-ring synthase